MVVELGDTEHAHDASTLCGEADVFGGAFDDGEESPVGQLVERVRGSVVDFGHGTFQKIGPCLPNRKVAQLWEEEGMVDPCDCGVQW